ncbi:hypothetical protein [Bacillus sp. J37]|uniref:hypothetical protein n=1 Tax=Bacillus sp. J37 TaxID=935837 RepID=UPI00047D5449|nr:hypothetical protein [Bacillus sp. J37]
MKRIGNINQFLLNVQIQDFYNYINFMEETITSHKDTLEKEFEHQAKELQNEEERQDFYESVFLDRYHDLDETYTLILRKSLFLSLYSFLETQLGSICSKLESKKLSNIKLDDISHKGILKYIFYIETVHNVPINITDNVRKEFLGYNFLRNYFVHNDKSPIKPPQFKSIKNIKAVSYTIYPLKPENHYIESFGKSFNEKYLDLISLLFKEVFIALEKSNIDL